MFRPQKQTGKVTIVTRNPQRVMIDLADETITLPFADESQGFVTNIQRVTNAMVRVPLTESYRPINHAVVQRVIYVDGGARPNPGAAAANFIVFDRGAEGEPTETCRFAKFYPFASSPMMEAAAMSAALTWQLRHVGPTTVIVCDNQTIYEGVLGRKKIIDEKIADIIKSSTDKVVALGDSVTLAHMLREHKNPADAGATEAILKREDTPGSDMFPEFTKLPKRPAIAHVPIPSAYVPQTADLGKTPTTMAEFAEIYKLKTRSSVPDNTTPLWANIVKHHLTVAVQADESSFTEKSIVVLMLPHLFLPKNQPTRKVVTRMAQGRPFELATKKNARKAKTYEDRMTAAVERLVADRQIRRANRMVHTSTNSDDMQFDRKVEAMKKKVLRSDYTNGSAPATVPAIAAGEVVDAVMRMNGQAATAIDGWTKTHLTQAMAVDSSIAVTLGEWLHRIISNPLPPLLRDIFVAARGVAFPKDEHSIRPIAISNLFVKILGAIASTRDGRLPCAAQYAIGQKEGAKKIIHSIRDFIEKNADGAVIKFDASNAYGAIDRKAVARTALAKEGDVTMHNYFKMCYGAEADVVMYGPEGAEFVKMSQGVKQGDATSSLLFCLTVDHALSLTQQAMNIKGIDGQMYMYMDDLNVTLKDPTRIDDVVHIVTSAFASVGLTINASKSSVLTRSAGATAIPVCAPNQQFVVLGANVNHTAQADGEYAEALKTRQDGYFDRMHRMKLHPQTTITLARIAGYPRLRYFCCVMPPEVMTEVARHFDDRMSQLIELTIDPTGNTKIPRHLIADASGLACPMYAANTNTLFMAYKQAALDGGHTWPVIDIVPSTETSRTSAQIDSQWMHTSLAWMSPAQYTAAILIRLGLLRTDSKLHNSKCNCGTLLNTSKEDTIDHILMCDKAQSLTHTHRHNMVRDACVDCARKWGITVSKEPTHFVYPGNKMRRPDACFHTYPTPMVTDFALTSRLPADKAITETEKAKVATHASVMKQAAVNFLPLVMATRGTIGPQGEKMIAMLAQALQPALRHTFIRDMRQQISTAAANGRADTILLAERRAGHP